MRRKRHGSAAPVPATVLAWVYALVSTYPLLWLVVQTFRSDAEILSSPFGLPRDPSFDAYRTAFSTTPLPKYFVNSMLVTSCVVLLSVACCVGAGYAFSRLRFPGSTIVFATFVGVLVIPAPVLLLPTFLISGDLGLLNSYIGLIAPYTAGILPVGVYLIKTHFDSIPDAYAEAAQMDRASSWQIFRIIMLPLVRPAAATVAVLAFMGAWNEYLYALVSLASEDKYTLPVGIADLGGKSFLYGDAPVFAAMTLSAVPVYVAFIVAQRSFVSSLTAAGGIKE